MDKGVQQGRVRHYLHDTQGQLEALTERRVSQNRLLDAVRRRTNIAPLDLVRDERGEVTEVKLSWEHFLALASPQLAPTKTPVTV